jgi:hypothetical protein
MALTSWHAGITKPLALAREGRRLAAFGCGD